MEGHVHNIVQGSVNWSPKKNSVGCQDADPVFDKLKDLGMSEVARIMLCCETGPCESKYPTYKSGTKTEMLRKM